MRHVEDNQEIKSVPPTRHLLAEYDRKRNERQPVEKVYKRQTLLIRIELADKLNALCKKRPRFKTQFVNFALAYCLAEIEGQSVPGTLPAEPNSEQFLNSGELSKVTVEQILREKLSQSRLDPVSQHSVSVHVMQGLFTDDHFEETKLRCGEKFQSPDVIQGRGKRYYTSARLCVEELIDYWIRNVKNNKLPSSLNGATKAGVGETSAENSNRNAGNPP